MHNIGRIQRIEEHKKTRQKTRPIIAKFVQYDDRNRVFRNKKKLNGQNISVTKSLTKTRMDKVKQAKETDGFTNVWTYDGKILFKPDPNAKQQICCS